MKRPINKGLRFAVFCVISTCMIVCMSSCRTVSKIEYIDRLDTVYIAKTDIEKEFVHDSVYVKEKSDTILIEKWHTRDRIVERVDTVVRVVDNIVKEQVEVEKVVNKTPWYCGALIWLLIILLIIAIIYIVRLKFFKLF